ncbi:MAG TPA: hypothetical protein VLH84_03655 [Patescibacteria group bacterium]|nr:hypothetical protein [Patescibacteria group bacterium]
MSGESTSAESQCPFGFTCAEQECDGATLAVTGSMGTVDFGGIIIDHILAYPVCNAPEKPVDTEGRDT